MLTEPWQVRSPVTVNNPEVFEGALLISASLGVDAYISLVLRQGQSGQQSNTPSPFLETRSLCKPG